jgi:thiol-disulfide isomerase/thioredoxin
MARSPRTSLAVLGALLASLLLAGCNSLGGTGDKGFVTGDGTVTELAASERGDPVELTGDDLAGDPVDLTSMHGTPVVVVVWGSWCAPCRSEAPSVVAAAEKLKGKATFVGINIRDGSPDQAESFVRNFSVPYPSIYSPTGEALLAFEGSLTPTSIPSFVVLDEQGRVAASIIGQLPSTTTLVDLVADVAAKKPKASADG